MKDTTLVILALAGAGIWWASTIGSTTAPGAGAGGALGTGYGMGAGAGTAAGGNAAALRVSSAAIGGYGGTAASALAGTSGTSPGAWLATNGTGLMEAMNQSRGRAGLSAA